MFYEMNTRDPMGATPWKRSNRDSSKSSFEGSVNIMAQITMLLDPDASLTQEHLVEAGAQNSVLITNATESGIQIPSFLPDG